MIAEPGAGGAPPVTGHVAVVIVKDNKTFTVTEMNIKGPYIVSQREMKVESQD